VGEGSAPGPATLPNGSGAPGQPQCDCCVWPMTTVQI